MQGSIGIFDSGFGGLTILKEIEKHLPQYNYLYLGDNARSPYGSRSFQTVYEYTLQCVQWFFNQGCPMVILACNTASAKALRTIQQNDLPNMAPDKRVLGVIRPTAETIGLYSQSGVVGILATTGTVQSESYLLETKKFFPNTTVVQEACPMWVPIVENNEIHTPGADYFIQNKISALLQQNADIDTILLACTHYPLLLNKIRQYTPNHIQIISQGSIVAKSLADYLQRHPEMEERCSKQGSRQFYTTDSSTDFNNKATIFYGKPIEAQHLHL